MKQIIQKIHNRHNLKLEVELWLHPDAKGLAFVMHGSSASRNEKQVQVIAQALYENRSHVVLPDITHSFNNSEGDYENATLTNYYEDLQDVIEWAESQDWYQEPYALAGVSLSGLSVLLQAEKHPQKVSLLVSVSAVVSGKLNLQAKQESNPEKLIHWKKTGWRITEHETQPGIIKKIKWSYMEDKLQYDALPNADKLTMPVLLIVGENDITSPVEHQKILYNGIAEPKHLYIIKNAGHVFEEKEHLHELSAVIDTWLKDNSHSMSKKILKIKNRHNLKLEVELWLQEMPRGLVFVAHGHSVSREQAEVQYIARAFKDKGFSVVLYDVTHSFNNSDGKYEDSTATNYNEDMEDVIAWAKQQDWYVEPYALAGVSLSGLSALLYAERKPTEVSALVAFGAVISGKLNLEAKQKYFPVETLQWQNTGWKTTKSVSRPGIIKRLPWSHMEDKLQYDALPQANRLTMPVLLIVGEDDDCSLVEHQKMLYEALPETKDLHIVTGAPHTFRHNDHLEILYDVVSHWIDQL